MEVISKLGIGPMSNIIIEAVFSYSQTNSVPLMLICSKNQVDFDRGYVFNIKEYGNYISSLDKKYPDARVLLCRDHCGPGHNSVFDIKDTYRTIDADIEVGFDLIHIDFCFHKGSYTEILNESKKAVAYIQGKSPDVMIEIGTDENNGIEVENINKVEEQMKFFTSFFKPQFFVTQTGSVIKEITQEGVFHKDYLKKVKLLADKYDLLLKEHNADYLSGEEISKRKGLISAMNVAPQFGILQTELSLLKATQYGLDANEFLELSYRSKKWVKWLNKNDANNKLLCSTIAGHYNFNTDEYKRLFDSISRHEDFDQTIQGEVHKIFDLYIHNLS